jgi:hypothetical protein
MKFEYPTPTCPNCGSPDITRDALAVWNAPEHRWEIMCTLENFDCQACGWSGSSPKWEVDEPEPRPRARVGPIKTLDEFIANKMYK